MEQTPKELLLSIQKKKEDFSETADSEILISMEKDYQNLFDLISTYFYLTNNPYQDYFSKLEKKSDLSLKEATKIEIHEDSHSLFFYQPFLLSDLSLREIVEVILLQIEYVTSPLPLVEGKEEYQKLTKLKDGILKQLYEQNVEWNESLLPKGEKTYIEKKLQEVDNLAKSEGNLASRAFYQALRMEKKGLSLDEKASSYFSLDSLDNIPESEQKNVLLLFQKQMSGKGGKEKGDTEGNSQEEVSLHKEKKIYWEKVLRNIIGGIPYGKRPTHMRLNRRQPLRSDLSGTLSDRKANLVCAVDTSYSMDKDQINLALSEILKLKVSLGFTLTLIQCDSKIQDIKKIKTKKDVPTFVKGRGGTSYIPVIEYLNEHKEYHNSVLIYFTDGYGDKKIPKPLVKKVLWIIVDEQLHISLKEPYGIVLPVHVDKD